ncbi:kinesin-2b-like [Artemia franciscana]|uniref:kinesin-2b-like n=1 Tax=Artemia franciscana TaxID=6661 RepID=UPI0032DB87CA
MKATNRDVYEKVTKPLVDSAFNGFNATIFAYGQTSSGKTHTMMGSKTERGVLELVVNEIFDGIESNPDREYLLRVSFIEIYQEQITDLLTGSTRLKVRDTHNEVVIKELSEEMCCTPDSLERANRRKTWSPSSSKNLKRLSFELPRAERSLNIQTPTSLHEESETLSSNEIEVVKNQLAVLKGVIKEDQEKYNLTIQDKEDIIHTFSDKIVDLEKNLLDLKNLYEESKSQIKILKSDTKTISHEKDVLTKQLNEKTSLVVEISEEIKNTQTSSESLTKLAQDRLTEIENLKKEIALTHCQFEGTVEFKERINTLQEELKSAQEKASDEAICLAGDYITKIKELQQEKEMSEEYKKIIQEKEDAIYNLSSKLANFEKTLLDSKNHYEESESQIEVLESDIKTISHEKDVLEKHLNEKTRLFVEISEEIKNTKISSESLTKLAEYRLTEIENLKKEIARTHCHFEETKDLKERINTLKEELVSTKEASDTTICLVAYYETEIEEVKQSYEKEMNEKKSRINLLEDLTKKLEDEVESYTEKLISRNEEVKCLQLSLESLKSTNESNQSALEEVAELQSKLTERPSDLKVLEVNINALQSKLDEAYSDKDVASKNHQQIIEEEQEKNREAMVKIAELEGHVSSLQIEIRDLGIHKEGFEEELKTLRDNLNEKEGLINEQKKLLASLNGHISELEANQTVLNEQVREIELLKKSLNETTAQLSEARANIKDDVKNEELKICLGNLKNEVVMFKANSQTLQEENEQLLASVQEKQKQIDDQKESINHLKIRISDMEGQLQIQISSAENEKEKLNEVISKGNEEILSLRQELTVIQDEKEQELLRFVQCEKDFQMKLDAKIAEAESLQVKIGELAVNNCQFQEFDQVQDLLTDSALKITELEEKMTMVANTEYELKHLRNEYATLETQRESALCALKEANLALEIKSKVEEQCAAYNAQLDSACSQIQELENQVKTLC